MSRPESYRPVLVSAGLHVSAERTPGKVALGMGDVALTYGELAARVRRVAGLAAGLGLGHGDRAVILAPNCLEYPELVCGLSDIGAIAATVNPRANAAELAAACVDCRARVVFAHASVADTAHAARAPCVERVIVLGPEYETLLAGAPEAGPSPGVEETDPFALVYTSGTTGRPKGILIPHRSRVLTFHGMAMEYGVYGPDDRQLAIAPLAHGAGFAFAMATLFFGGTIEILQKFDPELVVERLVRDAYTGVFMVPTHYQAILAMPQPVLERHRGRARALRAIISNAAALPQAVKEQIVAYWGEGLLHESYGSTEAGVVTNLRPADQLRKKSCVGLPFALTRVRLLDDQGMEVRRGEVGELFSSSPYLFNGYFGKPEETAACTRDGWVSAGDLARRDEDGYLYIVDRKKDMVVSGGVNIYPREIEDVLATHPAVFESAVVGAPDEQWGERLRAFVVLRPGAQASEAELLAHCRATLSGYKVPKDLRFIDAVPRNAGGKVLKKDLRSLA